MITTFFLTHCHSRNKRYRSVQKSLATGIPMMKQHFVFEDHRRVLSEWHLMNCQSHIYILVYAALPCVSTLYARFKRSLWRTVWRALRGFYLK